MQLYTLPNITKNKHFHHLKTESSINPQVATTLLHIAFKLLYTPPPPRFRDQRQNRRMRRTHTPSLPPLVTYPTQVSSVPSTSSPVLVQTHSDFSTRHLSSGPTAIGEAQEPSTEPPATRRQPPPDSTSNQDPVYLQGALVTPTSHPTRRKPRGGSSHSNTVVNSLPSYVTVVPTFRDEVLVLLITSLIYFYPILVQGVLQIFSCM